MSDGPYRFGANGKQHPVLLRTLHAVDKTISDWYYSLFVGEPDAIRRRVEYMLANRSTNSRCEVFAQQLTIESLKK